LFSVDFKDEVDAECAGDGAGLDAELDGFDGLAVVAIVRLYSCDALRADVRCLKNWVEGDPKWVRLGLEAGAKPRSRCY
jgi:hypothetical protein